MLHEGCGGKVFESDDLIASVEPDCLENFDFFYVLICEKCNEQILEPGGIQFEPDDDIV